MRLHELILVHAPRDEMLKHLVSRCVPNVECFFFGCIERPGHYLFAPQRCTWERSSNVEAAAKLALGGLTRCGKPTLDGSLCWNSALKSRGYEDRDETEGRAFITQRNGWTSLAFWDRSVDKRGGCNAVFIAKGVLSFSQMLRAAKLQWPRVWERFTFPVLEVDSTGRAL